MANTTPALPAVRPECACTALRRASRVVTQLYDEALAPVGLRITQYALLANLDRHGEMPLTALADAMSMDRTTLTRNLAPLERDGLLVVRPALRGRTKLAALTAGGRRRLRAAFPYWERAQDRFRAAVGAPGVDELSALSATIRGMSQGVTSTKSTLT